MHPERFESPENAVSRVITSEKAIDRVFYPSGPPVQRTNATAVLEVDSEPCCASTTGIPISVDRWRVMCAAIGDDDVGKTVVNASGEDVGMVTAVEHGTARVKPDPGITDSIKATLGWQGSTEDTYPLQEDAIAQVTGNEIRLSGDIHEGSTSGTLDSERTGSAETTSGTDTDRTERGGTGTDFGDDSGSRDHEGSSVPGRDVEGRGEGVGDGDRSDDRPLEEPHRDESALFDAEGDERTDRTSSSRGRDADDEVMDPDVGDGDAVGGSDDVTSEDRERRSRDEDSDDDSDLV